MKKLITIFVAQLVSVALPADNGYFYHVDLTRVQDDKVTVTLRPPVMNTGEVDFLFPAMVPGTYEVYDFGRFVSDLTVKGRNGKTITVKQIDVNTYRLSPAIDIETITYKVDDTFDKTDRAPADKKVVFEPGGTNFEEAKNYSINNHTMFGYFRNMTGLPFVITFDKPQGFYPATGLSDLRVHETRDTIRAKDYHLLVDSPIMYSKPDTAFMSVAQTSVLVAVYSPEKQVTAKYIAETLKELLFAQKEYLGGTLPVDKYAFLFYFHPAQRSTLSGANGALEHSYSSFYVLPEYPQEVLQQQIRDVAAHEFFHIVTPLNIHSEEIADFDFNNPRMSQHLWLYEGMTEYAAHHAQVRAGLIDVNEFLNVMMQKYHTSVSQYNDTMSFTYMSKNVLNEEVHKQYGNVYEKGAVIGMCLDILLRDLSEGKYGTQDLMLDLSRTFGKDSAFRDDELFPVIERLTYPQVGEFLRKHVGGPTPLPMEDILFRIGIGFSRRDTSREFTLGNPGLGFNTRTNRLVVDSITGLDEFGKALGYRVGDELYRLQGAELKVDNLRETISSYYQNLKEGDLVRIDVYRPRKIFRKRYRMATLEAPARRVMVERRNQISMAENITEKQKQTLRSWIAPFGENQERHDR